MRAVELLSFISLFIFFFFYRGCLVICCVFSVFLVFEVSRRGMLHGPFGTDALQSVFVVFQLIPERASVNDDGED